MSLRDDVRVALAAMLGLPLLISCSSSLPAPLELSVDPSDEVVLVGELTREALEAALPAWVEAQMAATLHPEAARALAAVDAGARVRVFLGTWCSDSRREVSHLWRALDESFGVVPFEVQYWGVSRETLGSEELVEGVDLDYLPTFVVERAGEEIGRIVESAPDGIDRDLLALLQGKARGVISGRPELADLYEGELDR